MTFAHVGMGGNQARRHLLHAVRLCKKIPGARLEQASPIYSSAPVGCPGRQPDYYNGALRLQTALSPRQLFLRLQRVERRIQRRRRAKNAPRRLDLDYLAHGSARLRGPFLALPHPRMHLRAFVLAPLSDVAGANFAGLPRAADLRAAQRRLRQSVRLLSQP